MSVNKEKEVVSEENAASSTSIIIPEAPSSPPSSVKMTSLASTEAFCENCSVPMEFLKSNKAYEDQIDDESENEYDRDVTIEANSKEMKYSLPIVSELRKKTYLPATFMGNGNERKNKDDSAKKEVVTTSRIKIGQNEYRIRRIFVAEYPSEKEVLASISSAKNETNKSATNRNEGMYPVQSVELGDNSYNQEEKETSEEFIKVDADEILSNNSSFSIDSSAFRSSHCNLYFLLDQPYQGLPIEDGTPLQCIQLKMKMIASYEDENLIPSWKKFAKSYFDCPNVTKRNEHGTFLPISLKENGENGFPGDAIFDVHPNLEHIFHIQQKLISQRDMSLQFQDVVRVLNTNYLDSEDEEY